jgi:Ankyrin repeats (many copies)
VRKMSSFEHHRTPLHLAVLKNRPQMIKLLLELGADASAKDSRGYTPLSLTTPKTNEAIVAALIAAGADPNERSANRFERAVPILAARSMAAAIGYYVWGDPVDFACVGREQVDLFLSFEPQGGPRAWMSIFVQDVDALYETYKKTGAIIRKPPADYPWGAREMTVEDLDGHRFRMTGDGGGENRSGDAVESNEDPGD